MHMDSSILYHYVSISWLNEPGVFGNEILLTIDHQLLARVLNTKTDILIQSVDYFIEFSGFTVMDMQNVEVGSCRQSPKDFLNLWLTF